MTPAQKTVPPLSPFGYLGTGIAPGDSKRCRIVLESNDDVATVTTFYQQQLA